MLLNQHIGGTFKCVAIFLDSSIPLLLLPSNLVDARNGFVVQVLVAATSEAKT